MIGNLRELWIVLPGFIIGLTVHEFAHAASAAALGDRYAAADGRLTLNPLAHLSPLGTLSILFLGFGWAKPVPVNIYNFKNPRRDFLLTSLAGPASNIALMLLFVAALRVMLPAGPAAAVGANLTLLRLLRVSAYANLILAIINLLPVPPLDGSRIWPFLFPYLRLSGGNYSWLLGVLVLAAVWFGALDAVFDLSLDLVDSLAGLR